MRSPVELGIGLLRCLHGSTNLELVARGLEEIGQAVFYPPNVKGWDGGRTWINTSTLLGRSNLIGQLLRHETTRFAGNNLEMLAQQNGVSASDKLVAWLDEQLLAVPFDGTARAGLIDVVETATGNKSQRIAELIHTMSTVPQFHLA